MSGAAPGLTIGADGCAVVTLRRPGHLNRLHREDLDVLRAHIHRVGEDPSLRALVLTGEGRAFCAGFHLGELGEGDAAGDDPLAFGRTVDALEALPVPTIARLNGSVYGGGTDLALACDFRIGVTDMELRMPAARLGLHYYPNGLQRYVTRLGLGAAKRLFLLAEAVDAPTLLRIGYLDDCVASAELDAAVQARVAALAANAPLALRGMKCSLNELAAGRVDVVALQARQDACARSEDLREGLAAFAERRAPSFRGR